MVINHKQVNLIPIDWWKYKEQLLPHVSGSCSFIGSVNGTRFTYVIEFDKVLLSTEAFSMFV